MMKTVCYYFQVQQPLRLKRKRLFNMGKDHNYLDDLTNRTILQKIAQKCYLPMNALLLDQIKAHKGKFRVAFSMSGLAIEQFRTYAPEVLDSFRALAKTGCVEFLGETYAHSLASLIDRDEFIEQVRMHSDVIKQEFGVRPRVFRNTELIYSDSIGETVAEMGFEAMLTEGAKHILGWKSPNFIYANAKDQKLRLLLRNFKLSDDIAFRFSNQSWNEWPLTVEKYVGWLSDPNMSGDTINLFMDYDTFGEHEWAESGIFDFMRYLPGAIIESNTLRFATPSEVAAEFQPVAVLHSPYPISWADEERDVTAWLGNELQNEAFTKLYALREKVHQLNSPDLNYVWRFMQSSDHFYYMATKWFSDGDVHSYFNPYGSPYEAFVNYMNVLSDFEIQIQRRLEAYQNKQAVPA